MSQEMFMSFLQVSHIHKAERFARDTLNIMVKHMQAKIYRLYSKGAGDLIECLIFVFIFQHNVLPYQA